MTAHFSFDNSYARLPEGFFADVTPARVAAPRMIRLNRPLAEELGLDAAALATPEGAAILSGQTMPETARPIAMAYAGHQFGSFVPQLGDGRAMLIGEIVDRNGKRRDIQLKGSGPTPFSRAGDGRAALGPVLREYVVSEAMAALGVPTTRALAAVATGDLVLRETALPGAILTRVAASHIRVGTFQYFAGKGDEAAVRRLADFAIARHFPEAAGADNPYVAFLDAVAGAQARLIAQWMNLGFIHGVMNTDNMAISGETIDYGPCAFMDEFDPAKVFSSIDAGGRYAYQNQPGIALWNLTRLAECLLPLLSANPDGAVKVATARLDRFAGLYNEAYLSGLRRKLGLTEARDGDLELAQDLFTRMAAGRADFTLTFRALVAASADTSADRAARVLFDDPGSFDAWAARWRARLAEEKASPQTRRETMRLANPGIIPRNHRVEEAIAAALTEGDFSPFDRLVEATSEPYEDRPDRAEYTLAPAPGERVTRTFCGT